MKHCLECKIQGQERETKDFTILPVAKYAHHKQAGINMDEHFYITKNRDSKKNIQRLSLCLLQTLPCHHFTKKKQTDKNSLMSKIFKSLNIHLKNSCPLLRNHWTLINFIASEERWLRYPFFIKMSGVQINHTSTRSSYRIRWISCKRRQFGSEC